MNSFWRKQGIIEAPVISQGCKFKGVFFDVWCDLNYQCDAWLGPNELREGWFGMALWYMIYFFHNAWRMIFLWNFRDGWYHLKLEVEILKIDGYYTTFLPFFHLPWPLISSDQMINRVLVKNGMIGTPPPSPLPCWLMIIPPAGKSIS